MSEVNKQKRRIRSKAVQNILNEVHHHASSIENLTLNSAVIRVQVILYHFVMSNALWATLQKLKLLFPLMKVQLITVF